MNDDDRDILLTVHRYLEHVHRVAADDSAHRPTELADVISAHLGVDATTVPITTESLPLHRYVDADIALDELSALSDGRVVGVTGGDQRWHLSASDLLSSSYSRFAPGPISYETRAVGPGAERRVVAFGVRLLTFDGHPLAVVQRSTSPNVMPPAARLELLGADPDATGAALTEIRRLMVERSVLRGQVLSFVPTEYGSEAGATFLARPSVDADEVVLGDGVLQTVVDHVVGIGDQRDVLRAAGQHLKRGVLLYGPPGTGKTLTVRHLLSRTPGTTAVVLTGSSVRFVTAAAEIARTFAPALVVLEDIDLVAADRAYSPQPVLFDVLDALDGLESDADIAFVMTTNHVQILEEALAARPGRVDLGVEIALPDAVARRRLFRHYAGTLPFSSEALDAAADRAESTTGSFAKELVRRTVLRAALRGDDVPTDDDLAAALDDLLSSGAALTRLLLGGRESFFFYVSRIPLAISSNTCSYMGMRWQGQKLGVDDTAALPGMERRDGLVRTVTTPEFAGITFHEVLAKTALNRVPGASAMPFDWTVNPYRGCSHACDYCFARKTHEYLDLDSGADFDSQIVVKINVADVLRSELRRGSWAREPVMLGTNTDPYQRAEGRYRLMPDIISALAENRTPFSILTKGTLLRRDLPLLTDAAKEVHVTLAMSIAVFDDALQRSLEPGTPTAEARLDTVRAATDAGFRVTVFLMPILPHLTDSVAALDHALGRIRAAGAARVVYGALHLRPGAKEWFLQWLEREHPELVSSYRGLYPGVSVTAPQAYRRWLGKRVQPLLRMHRLDGWDEDDHPRGRPQPGLAARTATAPRLGPVRTTGSSASPRPSVAPASEPTLF